MIEGLVKQFSALDDPRCASKVEHRLVDILVIAVCAVVAGETVQNLGWSGCSPKRAAGPALGDGMVPLEGPVHNQSSNFQHEMGALAETSASVVECSSGDATYPSGEGRGFGVVLSGAVAERLTDEALIGFRGVEEFVTQPGRR